MSVVFPDLLSPAGDRLHHTLQSLVLPPDAGPALPLYVRWNHPSGVTVGAAGLTLPPGSAADLTTFYNAFGIAKWRDLTGIATPRLRLTGLGRPEVALDGWTAAGVRVELWRSRIDLGLGAVLDPGPVPEDIVLLGVRLIAPSGREARPVRLTGGAWVTDRAPLREVRLAAVITTFRREAEARAAIRSFEQRIMTEDHPEVAHLYVIDNGGTLEPRSDALVTVEHSANLGGAGGFTRGLLRARDTGRFTHVLFMDDDAACEPESVWRACRVLSHATDPRLSVAGAMLLSDRPTIQYERTGRFLGRGKSSRQWVSVGRGRDLARPCSLAANETLPDGNFGGWWFFAFPLAAVEVLPFPFFVRGDDTDFALANRLPVTGLNGIAAHCGDLSMKRTPTVTYLALRAWFALAVVHGTRGSALATGRMIMREVRCHAATHDYARAAAALMAVEDVLSGPRTMAAVFPPDRMRALATFGTGRTLAVADLTDVDPPVRLSRWRRLWVAMLAQGHTGWAARGPARTLVCTDEAQVRRCGDLRHRTRGYRVGDEVRLFDRDVARYRQIMRWRRRLLLRLILQSGATRDLWLRETPDLRSEGSWRARLGLPARA